MEIVKHEIEKAFTRGLLLGCDGRKKLVKLIRMNSQYIASIPALNKLDMVGRIHSLRIMDFMELKDWMEVLSTFDKQLGLLPRLVRSILFDHATRDFLIKNDGKIKRLLKRHKETICEGLDVRGVATWDLNLKSHRAIIKILFKQGSVSQIDCIPESVWRVIRTDHTLCGLLDKRMLAFIMGRAGTDVINQMIDVYCKCMYYACVTDLNVQDNAHDELIIKALRGHCRAFIDYTEMDPILVPAYAHDFFAIFGKNAMTCEKLHYRALIDVQTMLANHTCVLTRFFLRACDQDDNDSLQLFKPYIHMIDFQFVGDHRTLRGHVKRLFRMARSDPEMHTQMLNILLATGEPKLIRSVCKHEHVTVKDIISYDDIVRLSFLLHAGAFVHVKPVKSTLPKWCRWSPFNTDREMFFKSLLRGRCDFEAWVRGLVDGSIDNDRDCLKDVATRVLRRLQTLLLDSCDDDSMPKGSPFMDYLRELTNRGMVLTLLYECSRDYLLDRNSIYNNLNRLEDLPNMTMADFMNDPSNIYSFVEVILRGQSDSEIMTTQKGKIMRLARIVKAYLD